MLSYDNFHCEVAPHCGYAKDNQYEVVAMSNTRRPLSTLRSGEKGAVVKVSCPHLRHRLAELGLNCGDCIHVIRGECHGPLIVGVKTDTRLALGRGMAHQIMVEIALDEIAQ